MKFQLYQDATDEWRWRLRAADGQIIARSFGIRGYKTKMDAIAGIDLVKRSRDAIIDEVPQACLRGPS